MLNKTFTRVFTAHELLLLESDIGCPIDEWINNMIAQKIRSCRNQLATEQTNDMLSDPTTASMPANKDELARLRYLGTGFKMSKERTLTDTIGRLVGAVMADDARLLTVTDQVEIDTINANRDATLQEIDKLKLKETETAAYLDALRAEVINGNG